MTLVDELAARCRFPDRQLLDCAVSGGADSLALLVLATRTGRSVSAVHVDHGLRPDSAKDAAVVHGVARRFGARFTSRRVNVDPGPNLEARARAARYAALPADVLTGHTADDQVETILLNLMRGAGVEGLAGIRPDRRPLLGLRRTETAALCAELGLDPVLDPSNTDPRFRRNRVRWELLPLLDDIAERDVVPVIAGQAGHLREVADLLAAQAADVDVTSAAALRRCPEAIARVALRRFIREGLGAEHPPNRATLDRALAVVNGEARSTQLGAGWRLRRSGGVLHVEAEPGLG